MKITMLGCGTSVGVPALGQAGWGKCNPEDERNRRQRCAVLVEVSGKVILVDAGPDIRNQLIPLGLNKIDALLITHTHSDHVAGLDDLRAFYWPNRDDIPVHATKQHSREILERFPYLFSKREESPSYFIPPMKMQIIAAGDKLDIGGCRIDVLHQDHGNTNSLGFLFDKKLKEIKIGISLIADNESSIEMLVIEEDPINQFQFNDFKEKESVDIIYVEQFNEDLWKGYSIIEPTKQMKDYKKIN